MISDCGVKYLIFLLPPHSQMAVGAAIVAARSCRGEGNHKGCPCRDISQLRSWGALYRN
jgi:hypothetical protein